MQYLSGSGRAQPFSAGAKSAYAITVAFSARLTLNLSTVTEGFDDDPPLFLFNFICNISNVFGYLKTSACSASHKTLFYNFPQQRFNCTLATTYAHMGEYSIN